jgi:excinuclease UvrABC helicase subunit UvrB
MKAHNITPVTIQKAVRDRGHSSGGGPPEPVKKTPEDPEDLVALWIAQLEKEMYEAAAEKLEFEQAAQIRDQPSTS